MLWSKKQTYFNDGFENEAQLEAAIQEVASPLFGDSRIYLDLKRIIGRKGKTRNIPDGYLLDLSSRIEPKLYLVEVELAKHDPLKHIAVQILEFSLSYESSHQKIKEMIKAALGKDKKAMQACEEYALLSFRRNSQARGQQHVWRLTVSSCGQHSCSQLSARP